ncbi:PIG-L family deacetylase, partial [Patescibacteria group bacterium]|nr:PIG-L family deacetylase [Patescibacteria group bacterium]
MENSQSSHSILVVAAHPDDEVLGCGGTIARLAALGAQIHILILGEGKTARGEGPEEQAALRQEIQKAHQILGVKKTHLRDFPDNAFD